VTEHFLKTTLNMAYWKYLAIHLHTRVAFYIQRRPLFCNKFIRIL